MTNRNEVELTEGKSRKAGTEDGKQKETGENGKAVSRVLTCNLLPGIIFRNA
jgi:hypothetical protein